MKDLLVVLPSRGRPHNLARLWEAMAATCEGDTTLRIGLDVDDPALADYQRFLYEHPAIQHEIRGSMQGLVTEWINTLSVPYTDEYRFIGHFGDDCVPRTKGWDVQMMKALEETPFAFGDDMEYGQRRPARYVPTCSCAAGSSASWATSGRRRSSTCTWTWPG